ncbi:PREDICTED: uncharacterized protein LOC108377373 [Rhagoletis zephyria]|uniref:uncharacterized protein LOC108377373 n=1 Tax=Rhagoletis zephyria TaxID=28612 RepID=UPI000811A70F|nr:PREDICTED: uncharacterized protein LOC108377373 [Rhagoletis zephyria]
MDLKALLLNSISSKHPLLFSRRMHVGKCCYSVTFEVNGKILTIVRIRQVYAKAPFQKRVQRRQRLLRKLRSSSSISGIARINSKPSLPRVIIPELADCATQTSKPQMRSRATETEVNVLSVHRQQQTIRRVLRKQGTQTDPNTSCHCVQTERRIATRGTQTNESSTETTSSQTENYCYNNQVQTETYEEEDQCMEREKEAVVFMLNEIGEMIINQNHLLQNNSTMLSQISEMTMLSKVAARQKNCKKLEKQYKMHRNIRKHGRIRRMLMPEKPSPPAPVDKRSQGAQATYPIGLSSKTTQTRKEQRQRRRFKIFCF